MHLLERSLPLLLTSVVFLTACGDSGPSGPPPGLPSSLDPVSLTTPKNTSAEATVQVKTVAGRTLAAQVVAGPTHGTVDLSPQGDGVGVRYTPNAGFGGEDQVTFRVNDGVSTVDGVVDITVTNRAPSATPLTARRPATEPFTFNLTGTDPDGDALTFEVVRVPTGGQLSRAEGGTAAGALTTMRVTYTPDPGFHGDDSFTYRVSDGIDASEPVAVQLPVNRLPGVVVDGGLPVRVRRNRATRIVLAVADADRDRVTPTLGAAPEHGAVSGLEQRAGSWRLLYTPEAGFVGADVVTLLLDDGLDVVPVEVAIEVANDAPVALRVSTFGYLGSDVAVTLAGADADGDALAFEIVTPPASGAVGVPTSLTPTTARVTYTPAGDATEGPQSFTFRVGDGIEWSAPATATVLLQSGAPVAQPTSATVEGNASVEITLTGIDQLGDSLRFAIASGPSHGTLGPIVPLGLSAARVRYTPGPGYEGFDFLTFVVSDGVFTSEPAAVGIRVTPAPDTPPTVVDHPVEDFTTHVNVPLQLARVRTESPAVHVAGNLLDNFLDLDGDGLTASLEAASVTPGATVTVSPDGSFVYDPPPGRAAADAFDYTVTDGITRITRTVTVSFAAPIWFVDDSHVGPSAGTATAPFATLGEVELASGAGETIVVLVGNSTARAHDAGFQFQRGQQLIGAQEGLTTALGTILPATAAPRPAVTNSAGVAVTLASGAVLRGVAIQGSGGPAIAGTAVDGATIERVDLRQPGGAALDLVDPTGVWTLATVDIVDPVGGALRVGGGAATIDADLTIVNSSGPSIHLEGVTGGTVTLTGAVRDRGHGVWVIDNTGGTFVFDQTILQLHPSATYPGVSIGSNSGATTTFTGGALDIMTVDATGFRAFDGGVVTVEGAGNRVQAVGASGVLIRDTRIDAAGVHFASVSASGAGNGIHLENTGTGPFAVTGDGRPRSGGTIVRTTDDGALFRRTGPVHLAHMVIGDERVERGDPPTRATVIDGAGVRAEALAPGAPLTLTGMRIARAGRAGVAVAGVAQLTVDDSEILDTSGWGLDLGTNGVGGTAQLRRTAIDGSTLGGVWLEQNAGLAALSFDEVTVANSQAGDAAGSRASGVVIRARQAGALRVGIGNRSSFVELDGSAIDIDAGDEADVLFRIDDARLSRTNSPRGAIAVHAAGSARIRSDITRTTIQRAAGSGVIVEHEGASDVGTNIDRLTLGDGTRGSGAGSAGVGIAFLHRGTGVTSATVTNSRLLSHGVGGIFSYNGTPGRSPHPVNSRIVLERNVVGPPEFPGRPGIHIQSMGDHVACVDVRGNESRGSGAEPGFLVEQGGASTFRYQEPGAPISIAEWLEARNAPSTAVSSGAFQQAASCR